MKKFLLFSFFDAYSPAGGMHDFDDAFDSLEAAVSAVDRKRDESHIVDVSTLKIVWTTRQVHLCRCESCGEEVRFAFGRFSYTPGQAIEMHSPRTGAKKNDCGMLRFVSNEMNLEK